LFALGLVLSAGLFAAGIHVERSHHHEAGAPRSVEPSPGQGENGEHANEGSGEGTRTGEPAAGQAERSERVLGINTETDTVVNLVILASLALAMAVLLAPRSRTAVWVAVIFCLVAAVFDVAEIVHQLSRSEPGLATLAAAVAVAHLATAALGLRLGRAEAASD
jgi:hypothetical protein